MTKEEIRHIIDSENGKGFSNNINLNGYTFTKNGSFIVFEFKYVEDVKICHIKYIYFKNVNDLVTIMVNCCNFWMGNQVQFIFYKEKKKKVSAIKFLEGLNFRSEQIKDPKWKWKFQCRIENAASIHEPCNCPVFHLFK